MTERSDDPIVHVELHRSTLDLLVLLLRTLADLAEPGDVRLTSDVRSYLMQALDNAADLDILFSVLADSLQQG